VDICTARLKDVLGTSLRLCIGARAVRFRYVDPRRPISCAQALRTGQAWVDPSARQLDILRLLADGGSVEEAAAQVRISARTVRKDLTRLACANGARTYIHAGALFQALAWT